MLKNKKEKAFCFTGPLAEPISSFFEEMRLSGHIYNEEGYYLRQIARAAEQGELEVNCLTKEFVESWCQKREHECHSNWGSRVVVRLSQTLCKPPAWCRIEALHRRFYYE